MKTLASLLVLSFGCHSSNNAKPNAEPSAAPVAHSEPPANTADTDKGKANDNDDDDKVAPGQNPLPAKPTPAPPASGPARTIGFDTDKAGDQPSGFTFGRTGGGALGKWVVKAETGAPSGANVVAQLDADTTDYRFPVAIADTPSLADVRLSVKCKQVSGKIDQGCGLMFRATDADNYYVTRANALEDNVRLYHVVKGKRVQFAGWDGKVKSGVWHDLRVDAKGDHFEVYFDGQKIMDANDKTFTTAGKVGLWTKADSVIYFD